MEAQTAAVAIVTPLLELVLTARAAVTFLTKNTVTKLAQTQAQTQLLVRNNRAIFVLLWIGI